MGCPLSWRLGAAGVALLLLGCCCQGAPAPAPAATDCLTVLFTLAPCLDYVQGTEAKPSSDCCKALKPVASQNAICLCALFNTTLTQSFNITVNYTRAEQLPTLCKVETPPPSSCAAVGIPVPGPASPAAPSASPVSKAPSAGAVSGSSASPMSSPTTPTGNSSSSPPPSSSSANTATPPSPNSAPLYIGGILYLALAQVLAAVMLSIL